MQVILLESIRKLGTAGAKVKVKEGYGRNYLIPYKKAIRITAENLALFEQQKKVIEEANQTKRAAALEKAEKLDNLMVNIIRQASDDGRLFGSVGAKDIAIAVAEKGFTELDRKLIMLNKPIKTIDIHLVMVSLHPEVTVTLRVNVARSQEHVDIIDKKQA